MLWFFWNWFRPAVLSVLAAALSWASPEAFQIGESNVGDLPGGKEADGIIGDFVLRNDLIEAVISCDAPQRRANMSTFYGDDGITPGCLYDLTLRGSDNDQIVIFSPVGLKGDVDHVRIAMEGAKGEAAVETFVSQATDKNRFKVRHEYRLRDGWQGLLVVTTLENFSGEPKKVNLGDKWTVFPVTGTSGEVTWADAVDPADKAGYAFAMVPFEGIEVPKSSTVTLAAGEAVKFARFLAVGRSPAEAVGIVAKQRGDAVARVGGRITDDNGAAVATARLSFDFGKDGKVPAYLDAEGRLDIVLPGNGAALTVEDIGRPSVAMDIKWSEINESLIEIVMEPASAIEFDIRDATGASIPCKAQFIGIEGTPSPDLGPDNRAHGCRDQYHSETGQFRVQLPPGNYRVVVTHGTEFGHHAERTVLEPGKTVSVAAKLERLVDTAGWVSADFHNHSTPSGDNTCGTDDRIINLAAEQIEFAPTTEHNRLYDWKPHIERLGLTKEIQTVPGIELTGGGAHFNAFPYEPKPGRQDAGAPVWQKDPRLNAVVLRDFQGENPHRWIQINHPDMVENFIDRNGDGRADGGYMALGSLIDAVETQNYRDSDILAGAPFRIGKVPGGGLGMRVDYIREFVWLQLLNRGHRIWGVAVCDAHRVHGNGVGGWRTYLPSGADVPPEIDWKEMVENAQAGRMILSTGPFLEVTASDGTIAGGTTRAAGSIDLGVRVQCTDWIDIDRVQVLVNGRQRPELNFTRAANPGAFGDGVVKFEKKIEVPLSQDSHLIVVAIGENSDLSMGYGSSAQAEIRPCAYNNPIFVDVDGGGFSANGDDLGYDLPVKQISVDTAKKALEAKGLTELTTPKNQ